MAKTHTVQPGENLSVIALRHGFRSWKTLYNYPENEPFRKKRPNPNLIQAGDEILIPDKSVKEVPADTGKAHTFKAASAKQEVEFSLTVVDKLNPLEPVPDLTVRLKLPSGEERDVKTDANGVIHLVEPEVTAGHVDVLNIQDEREPALIRYSAHAKNGFATNQSHVLMVPDKRKIVNRIATKHGVNRRSAWGKNKPKYATMDEDWDYEIVVIHHSGDNGETSPVEIERKHMSERGWDDVGYHYLIRPDGSLYEGRHLAYKGSHVEGANTHKIGILIMGDFEHEWWDASDDEPTAAQLTVAEQLIKTLKDEFKGIKELGGHRDYKKGTECPGGELYSKLDDLRKATGLGKP